MLGAARGVWGFLVYSDEHAYRRTFALDTGADRLRVGRGAGAELRLAWDREASRVHAELEWLGDGWALSDDGLSANGTFVNGDRVRGRRRLASGDRIRVGKTELVYRAVPEEGSPTFVPTLARPPVELSRMQRRVLIALSRPYAGGATHAVPATNQQIADELSVSVDAVKTHLRFLFGKFEITQLAQNQKRARLVELAFARGNMSERDLAT
jgi:pSer/pThr/pTyr-binding forkhead associated (FHA) protein